MSLYNFVKSTLRPFSKVAFDAKVIGAANVPLTGPLVVASNHVSLWDPPMLGTWFPRTIHFMAKRELWNYFLLGKLIAMVHAFPVDREGMSIGAIRRALHILRKGEVVGIFPEGGRNVSGEAQARNGAVLLASTAKCPLIPVALVGTNLASKRWRKSHVELRIGEPMNFQGRERKPTKAEISAWTQELAAKISELAKAHADTKGSDSRILLRR